MTDAIEKAAQGFARAHPETEANAAAPALDKTKKATKQREKNLVGSVDRRHLRKSGRTELWGIRCRPGFKEECQKIARELGVFDSEWAEQSFRGGHRCASRGQVVIVLRGLAIIIGLGAIAAVTHGTVLATGGYGWNTPASFYIALGCVQAGLAMALGAGMVRGILPKLAAVVLLVMCEAANFLATVDLQLTAAEDAAAPIHDAAAKRASAEAWVTRLDRDDRVRRAEATAAKVQSDAMAKSAEKGCAANCRAVLEAQVREVTTAVEEARQSLQLEQRQARTALDKAPLPPSATPLADKTGWQAWMIDLLKVGFRGFAVSIGAAILLAAGTHRWGGKCIRTYALAALVPETSATKLRVVSKQSAAGDVHDWVVDRLVATEDVSVPFRDLYMDYESVVPAKKLCSARAGRLRSTSRRGLRRHRCLR